MEKQFEELEIWDYIPFNHNYKVSSKGRVWSIKSNKYLKLSKDAYGYYVVNIRKDGTHKPRKVHRLVALTFYFTDDTNLSRDHIDQDKSNNNLLNLRFCTRGENNRNEAIRKNNTSGYKGITWYNNKWISAITINSKRKYLGSFHTKEETYEAYKKASQEYHGDFGYAP